MKSGTTPHKKKITMSFPPELVCPESSPPSQAIKPNMKKTKVIAPKIRFSRSTGRLLVRISIKFHRASDLSDRLPDSILIFDERNSHISLAMLAESYPRSHTNFGFF